MPKTKFYTHEQSSYHGSSTVHNRTLFIFRIVSSFEPITRPTLAKHKKHRIYPKQSRNTSTQLKPHGRNIIGSLCRLSIWPQVSLMVVGPSMSGKSFFVKQMFERDHIEYDDPQKLRHIHWFYGQYQDMFKDMRRNMGKDIYFKQN